MRPVQILLTDDQAELVAAALRDAEETLRDELPKDTDPETTSEEVAQREQLAADIAAVGRLMLVFQDASENPAKYTPSPTLAATLRQFQKRVRGEAQPASRRKRRASRHQRRRALRHEFRRNREFTEQYNAAVKRMEEDRAEAEAAAAEIEARVADQPKYTVTDGYGRTIIDAVPAEFILDAEGQPLDAKRGKIHLPFRKGS